MRRWLVALIILLTAAAAARSAETFNAGDLLFKNVVASRPGDRTVYSIVGTGMFRAPRADGLDDFIVSWLKQHPHAIATIVDRSRLGPKLGEMDYIWIADGTDELNIDLVRRGIVTGGMMADGKDYLQSIAGAAHFDPNGPDMPKRTVEDATYQAFMSRVRSAETAARSEKVGLWSDRYHTMMEEEGYVPKLK